MSANDTTDIVKRGEQKPAAYREDQSPRCSRCGRRMDRGDLGFDDEGQILCTQCDKYGLAVRIEKTQVEKGYYRICPSCKAPTMLPHELERTSVIRRDIYQCSNCGQIVKLSQPLSLVKLTVLLVATSFWGAALLPLNAFVLLVLAMPPLMYVGHEVYKRLRFPRSGPMRKILGNSEPTSARGFGRSGRAFAVKYNPL